MALYTVWDLETTTYTKYKRKANPFTGDNNIVVSGYGFGDIDLRTGEADAIEAPSYDWFLTKDFDPDTGESDNTFTYPDNWFTGLLANTRFLVGQNIKFDVSHAIGNPNLNTETNRAAWMRWIARGGMVWDIQLAEYLLGGMHPGVQYLSLDAMAPDYGGNIKVDEVKAMWDAGIDTVDIPEDLLIRYLIGDADTGDHGDIGNTELVFLGQYKRAVESGQLRSILLNMGALVFTIEAELNGMAVDTELAEEHRLELVSRLIEVDTIVNAHVPDDLPFTFNWNSGAHKSALIFGGTVRYKAQAQIVGDDGEPVFYQKKETHYILNNGETVEVEYFDVQCADNPDADDPRERFAGGKRKGEPKTKQVTVPDIERGPKQREEEFVYHFPRMTDPDPETETKVEGVYSTAADIIESLAGRGIEFLDAMSERSKILKDLGTYYWIEDDKTGGTKGMMTLVGDDGIVHHGLNMVSTVTGRLSSSSPNLQNVPKEGKSKVKEVFKSRFDGGFICASDFSSLEVYVQATLTNAKQLIADLAAGMDMHCVRLAAKEHMSYEEVYRLCRVDKIPEWAAKREVAKTYSFQKAYGAGNATIAASTGMPLEEVTALEAAENEMYPEIPLYYERLLEDVMDNREPLGRVVPHPTVPGITCNIGRSHFRTPDGKLYTMTESPAPEFLVRRGKFAGFKPTELKNYPVQGTGGEVAKAAMWLAVRMFYSANNFDGKALLVNQVHDALMADLHPDEKIRGALYIHACMLEASTFMEYWFKWQQPLGIPSETTVGSSWAEEVAAEIDPDVLHKVRLWIRDKFIGGHTPSFKEVV